MCMYHTGNTYNTVLFSVCSNTVRRLWHQAMVKPNVWTSYILQLRQKGSFLQTLLYVETHVQHMYKKPTTYITVVMSEQWVRGWNHTYWFCKSTAWSHYTVDMTAKDLACKCSIAHPWGISPTTFTSNLVSSMAKYDTMVATTTWRLVQYANIM